LWGKKMTGKKGKGQRPVSIFGVKRGKQRKGLLSITIANKQIKYKGLKKEKGKKK